MSKIIKDVNQLLREQLTDGQTILVGGFGLIGAPLTLIEELSNIDVSDLSIVSNNLGEKGKGLGKVLNQGKISKGIGSYFTSNPDVGERYQKGEIELQLLPQGTLSESIRAGGAGIGGYFTKTSVGTDLAKGKDIRVIYGEEYVFEPAIKGDVAFIKAYKADQAGNLVYYKTARNFNPLMATAAKYVIAEVEHIVEDGELDPEEIVTPHLFVDAIVQSRYILTKEGVVPVEREIV
ncbi:CoA transferase subunit A [Oceanobacillus damuensis]|uniref:CoA transferase subunit A n=1 Tax=Oceanobacillus damuensis TaxID=937928 RepID=UPI00082FF153|nr:CoA transferase subunit A [Oceanobacillus damuensis]